MNEQQMSEIIKYSVSSDIVYHQIFGDVRNCKPKYINKSLLTVLDKPILNDIKYMPIDIQTSWYYMLLQITPSYMWDAIMKCENAPPPFKCTLLADFIPVKSLVPIIEEYVYF
jgi:hypothetical protein